MKRKYEEEENGNPVGPTTKRLEAAAATIPDDENREEPPWA
jgi:hypothetical protein